MATMMMVPQRALCSLCAQHGAWQKMILVILSSPAGCVQPAPFTGGRGQLSPHPDTTLPTGLRGFPSPALSMGAQVDSPRVTRTWQMRACHRGLHIRLTFRSMLPAILGVPLHRLTGLITHRLRLLRQVGGGVEGGRGRTGSLLFAAGGFLCPVQGCSPGRDGSF